MDGQIKDECDLKIEPTGVKNEVCIDELEILRKTMMKEQCQDDAEQLNKEKEVNPEAEGEFGWQEETKVIDIKQESVGVLYSDGSEQCQSVAYSNIKVEESDTSLFRHETEGINSYLVCNLCNKRCSYYCKMKEHMRWHAGDKPFKCTVCSKNFTQLGHLKHHMNLHTVSVTSISKEKSKICKICNKGFYCNSELLRHMKYHSKEQPYCCKKCPKKFVERINLTNHLKSVHADSELFPCDQCRLCFDNAEELKEHLETHAPKSINLDCSYCEKRFPCKSKLSRHMLSHSGEKPLACTMCDKRFKHAPQLRDHIKLHFGQTFVCKPCGDCFDSQENLAKHLESHDKSNPLECKVCLKVFPCKSKLVRHEQVHTETPRTRFKRGRGKLAGSGASENVSVVSVEVLEDFDAGTGLNLEDDKLLKLN